MTYPRKVMRMTELDQYILKPDLSKFYPKGEKRQFKVEHGGRSYILEADPWITLETAWASQMCWFMPGSVVTITDNNGNSQTFVKE